MNNATIRGVIIFGALAIMGIIAIQAYLLRRTWDLAEAKFREKVHIALHNTASRLAQLNDYPLPSQNLIKEAEPNYYIVNINNIINANNLEYYLQEQFEKVALNVDFEYGIFDCSSREMVYGNYITAGNEVPRDSSRRTDLPAYAEFDYYFGVRFPNRQTYLLGDLQLTFVLSGILIFTMAFFGYALFVILRQKQLSEMQKDFINNMTHEFKTPISTIKLSSDFFTKNPVIQQDERLAKYAHIISEQNQRLNRQVEKVLQLARIEQQNFQLKKEKLDLHEVLGVIIESAEVKINDLQGKLTTELKATSTTIEADRLHLSNILHNLIDNAIKYRRDVPQVHIHTWNEGNKLLLSITDQGIGISKEHQGRVFQKFYRVPTGNLHNVKGFGLGLYYIKNICQAHGWKIQLESELNVGTTITISIS